MAQEVKTDVEKRGDDVLEMIEILRDDVAVLSATVTEYGKAQGDALRTLATRKAAGLVEEGAEAVDALKTNAERGYGQAEDVVRANPAAAIGIAAGIGFLIGYLTLRR